MRLARALALALMAAAPLAGGAEPLAAAEAGDEQPVLRVQNSSKVPVTVRVIRRGPDREVMGVKLPDSGPVTSEETVGYVPPGGVRLIEGALGEGANEVVLEPQGDDPMPEKRTTVTIGKGAASGRDHSVSARNRDFGIDDEDHGKLPETPDVVDLHQARGLIGQMRALTERMARRQGGLNCMLAPYNVEEMRQDVEGLRTLIQASRGDLPKETDTRKAKVEALIAEIRGGFQTVGTERRGAASGKTETENLSGQACAKAAEIIAMEPPESRKGALPDLESLVADTDQAGRGTGTRAASTRKAATLVRARFDEMRAVVFSPDEASRPNDAAIARQIGNYRSELDALNSQYEKANAIKRNNQSIRSALYENMNDTYRLREEVWRALGQTGYSVGNRSGTIENPEALTLWGQAKALDDRAGDINQKVRECVGDDSDNRGTAGRNLSGVGGSLRAAKSEIDGLEREAKLGHSTGDYSQGFFDAFEKYIKSAENMAGEAEKDSTAADTAVAKAEQCLADARKAAEPQVAEDKDKDKEKDAADQAVADGQAAVRSCGIGAIRRSLSALSGQRDRLDPQGLQVLEALGREDAARRRYDAAKARFESANERSHLSEAERILGATQGTGCPALQGDIADLGRSIQGVRAAVDGAVQAMGSCDVGRMSEAQGALAGWSHPLIDAARERLGQVQGNVSTAEGQVNEALERYRSGFLNQAANLLHQAKAQLDAVQRDAPCPKPRNRIADGLRKIKWVQIFIARADQAIAACDLPAIDDLLGRVQGKGHPILVRKQGQLEQAKADCKEDGGKDKIAEATEACKATHGRGGTVWYDEAAARYTCKCGEGFVKTQDGRGCISVADATQMGDQFCHQVMPGSRAVRPVDPRVDTTCECVPPYFRHPFGAPACQSLVQTAQVWCGTQRPGWVPVAVRGYMDYSCCPPGAAFDPTQRTCTTRNQPTNQTAAPGGFNPAIPALIGIGIGAAAGGWGGGNQGGKGCHKRPDGLGWDCGDK